VGIGATPSAWTATFKALQISSSSLYNNGANATFVGSNYFFDGTNNKYINSAAAAAYAQNGGEHIWYNAASGTAGNNVTFTARMTIDSSGNVGIGGTAGAARKLEALGTYPTSSSTSQAMVASGAIPSGATSSYVGFYSVPTTTAASFTCSNLYHSLANDVTLGSGSAVTSQYGFYCGAMTQATNNYGFHSNIASGSNRWNFYAAGTAQNYFAGDTGVGRLPSSSVRFFVQGANTSTDYALVCYNSSEQNLFYARNNGEITTGTAANSPYNLTTGSAANVFVDSSGILYRSTSSLRYKSDVTDATHGLADVLKLRSVTYKAKNSGDTLFGGLIAEEVHDAGLTAFVAYDKEGRPDAIHYGNMVALLVKAVQELTARVAELEAK
jgi:hypothetical protein